MKKVVRLPQSSSSKTRLEPFPNSWYNIGSAESFKAGVIRSLKFLGEDIIVFKTSAGRIVAMDAYCPHLGAHLGRDERGAPSKLKNDCVQCVYHHFTFNADGECVPSASKISTAEHARVRTWDVEVVCGLVFVYFHSRKERPTWRVSDFLADLPGGSVFFETFEGKLPIHPQELVENAVDRLHFFTLHNMDLVEQEQNASVDRQNFRQTLRIGKSRYLPELLRRIPIDASVEENAIGLGIGLARNYFNPIGLRANHLATVTPMTDGESMVRFYFQISFTDLKLPPLLDRARARVAALLGAAVEGEARRLSQRLVTAAMSPVFRFVQGQDLDIWANKSFNPTPLLIPEDGAITLFRRWCKQFYTSREGAGDGVLAHERVDAEPPRG